MSSIALGTAAFAAAGALIVKRQDQGERFHQTSLGRADYVQNWENWKERRPAPYVLAAVGSALTTAGVLGPLLSSPRERVPWWASIATAGVALGLGSWGTVNLIQGGSCSEGAADPRSCSRRQEQRDRGAHILLSAVPLLSLPVVVLSRRLRGSRSADTRLTIHPDLDVAGRAFMLNVALANRARKASP